LSNKHTISFDKQKIILHPLTVEQTLQANIQKTTSTPIQLIEWFIDKFTSLSSDELRDMLLSNVIAILVAHRQIFWNNISISSDVDIPPSDFIEPKGNNEITTQIGDYKFTNQLTFSMYQEAYIQAIQNNQTQYLNYYILAQCCTKGADKGIQTLLNSIADDEVMKSIDRLFFAISRVGSVNLDIGSDMSKMSIVSKNKHRVELNGDFFLS